MRLTEKISVNQSRQVSVRIQILLGFSVILVLALLIAVIGYTNLQALQREAERTLQTAGRVSELSLQVKNEFLGARQAETAFLNDWRYIGIEAAIAEHAAVNEAHLAQAHSRLAELDGLIQTSGDSSLQPLLEKTASLRPLLQTYEDAFQDMVASTTDRSRSDGLEASLQNSLTELESTVKPLPDPEPYQLILQITVSQRAFLGTSQQQYADDTRLLTNRFIQYIKASSPNQLVVEGSQLEASYLVSQIEEYQAMFQQLVDLETKIAVSTQAFKGITTDINTITTQIEADDELTLAIARDRLRAISRRSGSELILTTIMALSVGAVAAYLLGRQITSPLRRLSQAAELIGQGNLEQHIEVTGGNELATLANSFNSMAAQLRQVLGRLEQLVANRTRALEASAEVSRSLSTILNQSQLVSEVVNQIQDAFDYYHAHIYLFDDNQEYLVMAGGTGDAGLDMLQRGHKIPQGKGLVGRAAASNYVVLVPDVTQEADWMSNPLLPDTRSEIAVPIAIGDQVLGVLDVQHNVTGGLTREDARLLQSVASQVAIALRNARMFQEAQQRAEREAMINAISQKIRSANSLERVLQVAAQELGQTLNTQKTSVQIGAVADHQNGS